MQFSPASQFVCIGRILKANGVDGGLLVNAPDIDFEQITEPVWISFDGLPAPFFIRSARPKGASRYIIHLNDVSILEDALELVGKDVCIRAGLPEDDEAAITVGDSAEDLAPKLIGWEVWNCETGILMPEEAGQGGSAGEVYLGRITDFELIPGNPCLYIQPLNGSEILIPFHKDFIVRLDPSTMRIVLRLPDGLL